MKKKRVYTKSEVNEVLRLKGEGISHKDIALKLGIPHGTVGHLASRRFRKKRKKNKTETPAAAPQRNHLRPASERLHEVLRELVKEELADIMIQYQILRQRMFDGGQR